MNAYFGVAASLTFLLGVVHSILGELLIFRRLREVSLISSTGDPILEERHVRTKTLVSALQLHFRLHCEFPPS